MKTAKLTIDQLKLDPSITKVDLQTTQITGGYIYYYTDANGNDWVSFDGGSSWYATDLGYDWDWNEMVAYQGGDTGGGGSTPGGTGTGTGSGNPSGTGTNSGTGSANGSSNGTDGGTGTAAGSTGTSSSAGSPGSGSSSSPGSGNPSGTSSGTGSSDGSGGGDPDSSGIVGGYPGGSSGSGGSSTGGAGAGTSGTSGSYTSTTSYPIPGASESDVAMLLIGAMEAEGVVASVAAEIAAVLAAPEVLLALGGVVVAEILIKAFEEYTPPPQSPLWTEIGKPLNLPTPPPDPNKPGNGVDWGIFFGTTISSLLIWQLYNTIAPYFGLPVLDPFDPSAPQPVNPNSNPPDNTVPVLNPQPYQIAP